MSRLTETEILAKAEEIELLGGRTEVRAVMLTEGEEVRAALMANFSSLAMALRASVRMKPGRVEAIVTPSDLQLREKAQRLLRGEAVASL